MHCLHIISVFIPEASFTLRVMSLPACVCAHMALNHELVRAITLSTVSARVIKCGPGVVKTLVKIRVILWGIRP